MFKAHGEADSRSGEWVNYAIAIDAEAAAELIREMDEVKILAEKGIPVAFIDLYASKARVVFSEDQIFDVDDDVEEYAGDGVSVEVYGEHVRFYTCNKYSDDRFSFEVSRGDIEGVVK